MSAIRDSGVSVTRWICTRCGSRYTSPDDCILCKAVVRTISSSEAGDDPLVGTLLDDRYQIIARIGKGAVGSIFRAIDTLSERQVAIKVLRKHLTKDPELRRRFDKEAEALKRLQHINLISVRDFGVAPQPYFVMEYLDGQTLAELLGELSFVPPERLIPIVVQVCAGIGHAHEAGILHRDIKPTNIMLIDLPRQEDFVKVVDFGLAKILDSQGRNLEETMAGDVIGTPLYMSPEQARGIKCDARSDIYSFGCVVYECLTGQAPIKGGGIFEILKNQETQVPSLMSEVLPALQIPQKLEEIVARCLKKNPDERYATMRELEADLLSLNYPMKQISPSASRTNLLPVENKPTPVMSQPVLTEDEPKTLWQMIRGAVGKKKPDQR